MVENKKPPISENQLQAVRNLITSLVNELTLLKGRIDKVKDENPLNELITYYKEHPELGIMGTVQYGSLREMNLRISLKNIEITRVQLISNLRDIDRIISKD